MSRWLVQGIFWTAVIYRLINCLLVQTSFVPDEYWQSIEPAHRLVFGYGKLSWEWDRGLRSYLYPLVFAAVYKILDVLRLDSQVLLTLSPRLIQSVLAAISDLYLFKFAEKLYGERAALWTLISYWLNWFVFFCSPRTLANTVEAQLSIIALSYYKWPPSFVFDKTRGGKVGWSPIYLTIAAISTIVRPTSAVFWLPLCLWHLIRSPDPIRFVRRIVLPATLPIILLSLVVDWYCYGSPVFSLWRFLEFNVLQGGSAHFGTHPWHWYFTNCLPTICLTHIIFIAIGIYKTKDGLILGLCSFYILVHSFLAHKELRFLLPLLGPLFTYAGRYFEMVFERETIGRQKRDGESSKSKAVVRQQQLRSIGGYLKWTPKRLAAMIGFLFVTNIPVMIYTAVFHQRGVLDVVKFLHDDSRMRISAGDDVRNISVWFLTPCYTSPGYSHLHLPVDLRMLDCTPNLDERPDYVEEADRFHADPIAWIEGEFKDGRRPSHAVMYDWMWTRILRTKLEEYGYRRCGQFYNSDFPQSDRQSKHLIVACKR